MIEVRGLTRRYGPLVAVQDLTFDVGRGDILGFIGPNGAGKTTTMRILTCFLPATEGTARVAGYDVFEESMEVRRKVGYLPELPPLYRELTVGQYLLFVAELRGVPRGERRRRVGEVMEQVGLRGWEDRIVGSLSKGYRQRVGLAQALVHRPEVLILDEPTSGLDPRQTADVRALVADLAGSHTLVLSTHILREVEALCNRVIVIDGGRIVASGTLDEVRALAGPPRWRVTLAGHAGEAEAATTLAEVAGVTQVEPVGEGVFLLDAAGDSPPDVAATVVARGWRLAGFERVLPGLEDAFLAVVGREHPGGR